MSHRNKAIPGLVARRAGRTSAAYQRRSCQRWWARDRDVSLDGVRPARGVPRTTRRGRWRRKSPH